MTINVICVGKIKEKFINEFVSEYEKRLSKYVKINIYEVKDESIELKAKKEEAIRLKKYIKSSDYIVALCIEGEMIDSNQLANKIKNITINGKSSISFIIGGSVGLDDEIKEIADYKLSFSKMTFPHQLMRGILLEQIYRAYKIINNEIYHK